MVHILKFNFSVGHLGQILKWCKSQWCH